MPVLSRKKRIALVLAGLAAFVLLAHNTQRSLSRQREEQASPPPAVSLLEKGMSLPENLVLETIDGKKSTLADYHGKVVVINFWAGWCGPCLHEMPGLFELQRQLAPKGLVVLGLDMDEDPRTGMLQLKKTAGDPPFPIFRGLNSALAERFAIEGLPFTVIVDKNFKIDFAHAGEIDWKGSAVRGRIEGLL